MHIINLQILMLIYDSHIGPYIAIFDLVYILYLIIQINYKNKYFKIYFINLDIIVKYIFFNIIKL